MRIKIAPSILTADFSNLIAQLKKIEDGGADVIHLDIMDGHFVPNLTFGPPVVKSLRKASRLPFEAHLMVEKPEIFIDAFVSAEANIITVHAEACPHLHRVVQSIKANRVKAGVAINPATPLDALEYILEEIDQVLIMTVNPGWGGQNFIPQMLKKIEKLRSKIIHLELDVDIEVDGGVNFDTIKDIVCAGANSLVIGSALFNENDLAEAVQRYRRYAEETLENSWWRDKWSALTKGEG